MKEKAAFLRKSSIVVAVLAGVLSCSSGNSERFRQAPAYASPVGTESWSVLCHDVERREIIVMENRTSTFYKEDGSVMTREEFCAQNRTIPRT